MIDITTPTDHANGTRRMVDDELGTIAVGQVMPHSQLGQDAWVLAQLNFKQGGTFVDVGAHDGIHFSNTYLLEHDYGWTGVCVECSAAYQELRANRKCRCINKAAWRRSGDVLPFHQHESPMLSGLSSLGTESVETISLNDVCSDLGSIDYLSLDTEGSEAEILSTFDFDRFAPKCMTIEHNNNVQALSYFIDLFHKHGYLWRIHHWDVLAVKDAWRG